MIKNQPIRTHIRLHWPLLLIIVFIGPLFLLRLTQSPNSWYDEGLNINAAQTLLNTGKFGLSTLNGIRLADPAIQTGLPMLILIGIVNKLFVDSLFAIRFIMVIFGILTLISLYVLAYRIYGQFAAFLFVLMLLVTPSTDTTSSFIFLSRQFLGEIPALLCITLGCHLALRTRQSLWVYALIGVFWGLAIILKSQVLLVLSVTVVIWVLYRIVTRKSDKFSWLLTVIVMFGLYGLDTMWRSNMAGPMLADNLTVLREGIGIHILPFRALKNLQDNATLARFGITVFSLFAALFFQRKSSSPEPFQNQTLPIRTTQNFIILLSIIWMSWFTFISIGWGRYSFIGGVFTFIVLAEVVSALWFRLKLPTHFYSYLVLLALGIVATYLFNLSDISDTTGDDFFKIVTDIKTQIPTDARIVSVDWAVDNFIPQHFSYPSTHVINVVTENVFISSGNHYVYDSLAECPQYVLLGSLLVDEVILTDALKISKPEPLFTEGIYKLYEIDASQLTASCKKILDVSTHRPALDVWVLYLLR